MASTSYGKKMKNSPQPGDETRRRLIDAGIEVFGLHGYEAATTRMLAKSAGVNLAAIPYHFGGKEGLYQEVVKTVALNLLRAIKKERSKIVETIRNEKASPEEILEALDGVIREFGRIFISSDLGRQAAPIIMREQLNPTRVFDELYEKHFRGFHEKITILVARLKGLPTDGEDAVLCAHAIIGQVFIFRIMRETAKRRLMWDGLDDEKTVKICDVIIDNVHKILLSEG